jgi:regulator of sirC expression with transglutaminase-like and TPR domain
MAGPLTFEAPSPLEYFASLVADDASLPLLEAAISIAQDDFPQLDTQSVLAEFDRLAARLKQRFPPDAVPVQRLRWLNRFFFQELGFAGNVNNFYDPDNSYLHRVIDTRRGIPITLAIVYVELATQIGLTARGVSFPGHFLIKLRMATGRQHGEVVIDPFTGHSLSRDELDELLIPYKRSRGLQGDFDVPLGLFLQAASPREVIARMLRNLKEIHRETNDRRRALQVQERLVVLLPQAWEERRDRGLLCADLGLDSAAESDLTDYLEHALDASDRSQIAERLAGLRGDSGPAQLR